MANAIGNLSNEEIELATQIISNIDGLYTNAITQLTTYTLGVIALVGVLIPAVMTFLQWRSLKAEKENLEKHIQSELSAKKLEIMEEVTADIKLKFNEEKEAIKRDLNSKFLVLEKKLHCSDASSFHLQGNSFLNSNSYAFAVKDYCTATRFYLLGDDELNGRTTLDNILNRSLDKVNQDEYEEYELESSLNELIDFLKTINENNRYEKEIRVITKKMKLAAKREVE